MKCEGQLDGLSEDASEFPVVHGRVVNLQGVLCSLQEQSSSQSSVSHRTTASGS